MYTGGAEEQSISLPRDGKEQEEDDVNARDGCTGHGKDRKSSLWYTY